MSEERLRALLAEAQGSCCNSRSLLQDVAFACRGLKPLSDEASTVVGPVFRQRDEARAEVERLKANESAFGLGFDAGYKRGAEAMREIALLLSGYDAQQLQTVPIPERRGAPADPFGDTKFIRSYPMKAQAQGFLDGLRACGVTSPLVVVESPDRHSPTGVWFGVYRDDKEDK